MTAAAPAPLLELRGVTRSFTVSRGMFARPARLDAVAGIDLDVRRGEVLGIVGGSGTGKSVLLRTIVGLNRPRAGSVHVFGEDLLSLPDARRKAVERRFGVLFQKGALFSSLTVTENVALPLIEHAGLSRREAAELAALKIALAGLPAIAGDKHPSDLSGGMEPELDRLSNIIKAFNEQFGTLFADTDRIARRIRDDIAPKVAADAAFQNARENTPHNARQEHDKALGKVMQLLLKDDTQVYKQYMENESFRRFAGDMVYAITAH